MGKEDYFLRANDFYTKGRALNYHSGDFKITERTVRYKHISKTVNEILSKFDLKNCNILDYGCGEGRYFHLFKGCKLLVGVDASKEMLLLAQKRFNETNTSIKLIQDNLLTFNPEDKFDVVFSSGVLCEHCPLTLEMINRIYDSLNEDGYFFFTTTIPGNLKLKLRRSVGDVALIFVKHLSRGKIYRKLLNSYKSPKEVKRIVQKTNFKILEVKKVNNPGSHVDQTYWLLQK